MIRALNSLGLGPVMGLGFCILHFQNGCGSESRTQLIFIIDSLTKKRYHKIMPIKDPEKRRLHHNEYMKNVWYPKNRTKHKSLVYAAKIKRKIKVDDILSAIKAECAICGEKHPATLDFHHIDPNNKKFTISTYYVSGCSKDKIIKETEKCIVLCSNCHRKLHFDIRQKESCL